MAERELLGKRRKRRPAEEPLQHARPPHGGQIAEQKEPTQPAQEWGEQIATGKRIARGGKSTDHVPGATEQQP